MLEPAVLGTAPPQAPSLGPPYSLHSLPALHHITPRPSRLLVPVPAGPESGELGGQGQGVDGGHDEQHVCNRRRRQPQQPPQAGLQGGGKA